MRIINSVQSFLNSPNILNIFIVAFVYYCLLHFFFPLTIIPFLTILMGILILAIPVRSLLFADEAKVIAGTVLGFLGGLIADSWCIWTLLDFIKAESGNPNSPSSHGAGFLLILAVYVILAGGITGAVIGRTFYRIDLTAGSKTFLNTAWFLILVAMYSAPDIYLSYEHNGKVFGTTPESDWNFWLVFFMTLAMGMIQWGILGIFTERSFKKDLMAITGGILAAPAVYLVMVATTIHI